MEHTHTVTFFEWLTFFAILLGPLVGIWVTRWVDKINKLKQQQMTILNVLLGSRGQELSEKYIEAINLIPVYFQNETKVLASWEIFLSHAHSESWNSSDQGVVDSAADRWHALKDDLIEEIARSLQIKLPKKNEHKKGYYPRAWGNVENEQTQIRRAAIEVLEGKRSLLTTTSIHNLNPTEGT